MKKQIKSQIKCKTENFSQYVKTINGEYRAHDVTSWDKDFVKEVYPFLKGFSEDTISHMIRAHHDMVLIMGKKI